MDKNTTKNKEKSIELRSEKVRNIVGQIPSLLIRQGILIIGLVLLVLLGISAFIPYKKTIPVKISIRTVPKIEMSRAEQGGIFLIDTIPQIVHAKQVIGHILHKGKLMPVLSPISGKLTLNPLNNDSINSNQLLFAVIPEEIKNIYGKCLIDYSQRAMIKEGQKVELSDNLEKRYKAKVSTIYPIHTTTGQLEIRISLEDFQATETVSQLKGKIILEETTFLRYFMKSLKI